MRQWVQRWLHGARPPVCGDVAEWARARGLSVTQIHPPVEPPPWPADVFGEGIDRLREDNDRDLDRAQSLVALTGARVRGVNGFVILPDGSFCLEGNWLPRLLTAHPDYRRRFRPGSRRVAGPVFPVMTYWGSEFYHWFHEAAPRLLNALPHLPRDTRFLVPRQPRAHLVETLKAFGLPPERWVELDPGEECEPEVLWFATPLGNPYVTAGPVLRDVADRVRRAISPDTTPTGRRFWVSRAGAAARRVVNEQDLHDGLTARGFEVVQAERLTFTEQVRLFSGAACVAGPHGAGLMHLMHLAPGGQVFEVMERTDVRPFYQMLSQQFSQAYGWHAGERVDRGAGDADIRVDPGALFAAVDRLLSGGGAA